MRPVPLVGLALLVLPLAALVQTPAWPEETDLDPTRPTAATTAGGTSDGVAFWVEVTAWACDGPEDGICLGYNGTRPGPTLVVREGDTVHVTLVNRIAGTLPSTLTDPALASELGTANVSLHTHGVRVDASADGISPLDGTALIDSSVGPDEALTYTYHAPYAGVWHYHDHVMGPDGAEGQHRGLFGALVVLGPDAPEPIVGGLHLTDDGVFPSAALGPPLPVDEPFLLAIAGLGNAWWTLTLHDPAGNAVDAVDIGPGVSLGIPLDAPQAGTYTWEAHAPLIGTFTGEVTFA